MATITTPLETSGTKGLSLRVRSRMGGVRVFLIYAVLFAGSLFFLFPLIWMVSTSLKTVSEVGQPQLNLIPANPQWTNYAKLVEDPAFYRDYLNSIFIVSIVLMGTVTSISLVAYSFSRLQW